MHDSKIKKLKNKIKNSEKEIQNLNNKKIFECILDEEISKVTKNCKILELKRFEWFINFL